MFAWHKEFKKGWEWVENEDYDCYFRTSITDENIYVVRDILEDNRRVKISEIAEKVEMSYESCRHQVPTVL